MSILDRLGQKKTGQQPKKNVPAASWRRMSAELEDSAALARELYPGDERTVDAFSRSLREACHARCQKAMDYGMPELRGEARFFLSEDRMCAFACLLPPENGGAELSYEEFLGDLRYEGIVFGVLEEACEKEFARGPMRIFPVARGKAPRAGEDGKVTELFQRRKNMRLEVQSGSDAHFSQDIQLQPIRKGTVICLLRPPRPGADGMDVTGRTIPPPPVLEAHAPQGRNTELGRGGQALVAKADGILYMEDGRFCIHEQKIIDGSLDQFQGVLQVSGNLYIGGNVDGGVEIEASGEIVINGRLGAARVTSTGGTIRVQNGVYGTGDGRTCLRAAGQVQAPVVEKAEISAGTSLIAETVSDSVVRCGGTVYVMSGRGMIVNSQVYAGDSVLCLRAGNLAGGRNRFSVGCPPEEAEAWEPLKKNLADAKATVEKLWNSITALQRKGSRLSDGEKDVLRQLLEQRELYIKRRESLAARLKAVNQVLRRKTEGRVRCDRLYPVLEVRIGLLTAEITTQEEHCDIHVENNEILTE